MNIEESTRIVLKIGSSLIVDQESGALNEAWLASVAADIASLRAQGKDVVVVSSGAVALGRRCIESARQALKLEEKQAAAACGQSELVRHYQYMLQKQDIQVAQILITLFDSENRRNYLNVKNTIQTLLENGVVPIINENDTVATHELRFGDNDRLAARVAQMISADLLILLSDIDGLYTENPKLNSNAKHVAQVDEITDEISQMAGAALSAMGSGGMITKVEAAKIAASNGCHTVIALGKDLNPIKSLENGAKATWFNSNESPMSARKKWIASNISVVGDVIIDDGALKALEKGKSLLPAGVIDIEGEFDRGDTVEIKDAKLNSVGKGLIAYSSDDARLIMGQHSMEIENIIGFSGRNELIHRDDMVFEGRVKVLET